MGVAVSAGLVLVAGCTSGATPACARGEATREAAVSGLLSAAVARDGAAAERYLVPGAAVDVAALADLGETIGDHPVNSVQLTLADQLGTAAIVDALIPDGPVLVGSFEVHEVEGNAECYAVLWGTFPDVDPGGDASGTATP